MMLAGCAPRSNFPAIDAQLAEAEARKQRIAALEIAFRRQNRVYDVATRIMAANTALCGEQVKPQLGMRAFTLEHFGAPWREIAHTRFGVHNHLTITHVVADSPADIAGLRAGDKILAMNGKNLQAGKWGFDALQEMLRNNKNRDLTLTIQRQGERRAIAVKPATACDYPVFLIEKNAVNAYADGAKIYITTGMLRFVENDEELALIIGHELAHNTRGHIKSKVVNTLIGAFIGGIVTAYSGVDMAKTGAEAGSLAFSQEFEAEADYVGLYYAGRAGYDLKNAVSFWRRLGVAHPAAIHLRGSTHPSTAKRFLAIEKALAEFEHKRANGLPLVPDQRKGE